MAPAIRPRSRTRAESTTTRKATLRSKCRATGRWIGSPIQDSAAITRIATSVMVPTRRIELRPGAQPCLEDDELSRLRERCRERAQERQHGAGERHAVVRYQSERHVLHRGHIRLFAGTRQ